MGMRENAAVMERTPESVAHPVEYRLLATQRLSTLLEEIAVSPCLDARGKTIYHLMDRQ